MDQVANPLLKKSISLILKSIGFTGTSGKCLDVLVNLFELYLEELASHLSAYIEHTGRRKAHHEDILLLLCGLSGSHVHINKVPGAVVGFHIDIEDLLKYGKEFKKAKGMRKIDAHKKEITALRRNGGTEAEFKVKPHFDTQQRETLPSSIPPHFPPFPESHSYKHSPVYTQPPPPPSIQRSLVTTQHSLIISNLKRLMKDHKAMFPELKGHCDVDIKHALVGSAGGRRNSYEIQENDGGTSGTTGKKRRVGL